MVVVLNINRLLLKLNQLMLYFGSEQHHLKLGVLLGIVQSLYSFFSAHC